MAEGWKSRQTNAIGIYSNYCEETVRQGIDSMISRYYKGKCVYAVESAIDLRKPEYYYRIAFEFKNKVEIKVLERRLYQCVPGDMVRIYFN